MHFRHWSAFFALPFFAAHAAPIPHHLFLREAPLTASSPRAPREIGDQFTASQMDAPGLYLANEYRTEHNGVTHLVYRQRFQGLDVHHAEWRVNIDRDGRVINAGGSLFQAPVTRPAAGDTLLGAARAAITAVNPILARESTLRRSGITARGEARFIADGMGELTGAPVWYPIRGVLQPAWNFIVTDADGISTYDTVIDAASEALLAKRSLTMFQSPPRGSVYTSISPQPPVIFGVASTNEPPYVQRMVVPFAGSPTASPKGWITGNETAGNNTITGLNPAGVTFLPPTTTRSSELNFEFPLLLGPDAPLTTNYPEAVTTNLFYWVNRAHDLLYEVGFDEAAGNFQTQNFSGAGISGDAMLSYAQFGTQALSGSAALNNAFFTTRDRADGSQSMIAMYLVSNTPGWSDGSLASDVIIHEYAHGVTSRLIPTMNSGFQGQAMNEALSDFWALEFLVPEGASPDGVYPISEYWTRNFGIGLRSRPYSTNLEINPLTYADLGRAVNLPAIHQDGGIWVEALWDVRANLIRQLGETEGRRRLRRIVIDGMKMSPPAPSMVDLRDAILLAERVDYKGESQTQLWDAFAKRGLGVLAYSPSADTIQVTASFDKPSNTGIIGLQTETPNRGEPLRITVFDGNYTGESMELDVTASSGDQEKVILRRDGLSYSGTVFTTSAGPARPQNGALSLIHADQMTIYYNDLNTGTGSKLVEKTVQTWQDFSVVYNVTPPPFTFPNETATGLRVNPGTTIFRQTLPFPFPFYGKKYYEVRILPEGYLQFDTALTPPCIDEFGFAYVTGIAPMASWMRTNGAAQPNENVYTSRGPNTFTVRWAGETVPIVSSPPFTAPPEPVNFAVTLHENGTIQYFYGSGNQNLVNSTPIFGCLATTPYVGISRGIGNGAQSPSLLYERVNFKDAPSPQFIPARENATVPVVRIESPAADAAVTGILPVRGIIYDTDTLVSAAHVLIDGVFYGNATRGVARPDICNAERLPGCPNIGFTLDIDLKAAGLKPGAHTFRIRGVNAKGGFQDYPESPIPFTINEGDGSLPTGVVETPAAGDVWNGLVLLRGYAFSKVSRVSAVDVLIDGVSYGRAVYGFNRQDICAGAAAGSPNCPGIGWQVSFNTLTVFPGLTAGEHRLQIRITEDNGRLTIQPEQPILVKVEVPANVPPTGAVTQPANAERVSGVITVSGHGWDPDGRVLQAILVVDGQQRVLLRYGLPRPDACAELTDAAACPNIGFEGTFDTRTLSNGAHRLGVLLVDNAGRSILIPGITTSGMNITVDNP